MFRAIRTHRTKLPLKRYKSPLSAGYGARRGLNLTRLWAVRIADGITERPSKTIKRPAERTRLRTQGKTKQLHAAMNLNANHMQSPQGWPLAGARAVT